MNALIALLVIVVTLLWGGSAIHALFSPTYRKRRNDKRAAFESRLTGRVLWWGAVAFIAAAAADTYGLIDLTEL